MEIKGRVKAVNGPVQRMKKDGSGEYTILDVDVQIGTYMRKKVNYNTEAFETVEEAEIIRASYFGTNAEEQSKLLSEGDVVSVKMHHYINQYGRNELYIDSILPINAKVKAVPADDLPF